MNVNEWKDVQKRYRNSVVQIFSTHGAFNLIEPYFPPQTQSARGSGFLISKEGHIITNAHVVDALITGVFRSESVGNKDLGMKLIAICPPKDIALLKASSEALKELGDFEPMTFGDDNNLIQTQSVMAIGYPLGKERLKFTAGVVSGYESTEEGDNQTSQSYIQIDLALNPGNSGGPLVTKDGKVIGVNSAGIPSAYAQNTNFAIPSRVVLSILRELFSREDTNNPLVLPPRLGLSMQRVTKHHFMLAGFEDERDQIGLRVKEIVPGTPFEEVRTGDILQIIEYADPYNDNESFKIDDYRNGVCRRCNSPPDTFIEISRFGNIKLFKSNNGNEEIETEFTKNRKVSLQEVMDTIPIDTMLTLQILRPGNKIVAETKAPFRNNATQAIRKVYPPFDKLDYLVLGGAVWVPLSTNIISAVGETRYLCNFLPFKARDKPRVMITKIFPENDLKELESIDLTEVLQYVSDKEIYTLDDMKNAILNSKSKYITLKFLSGKEVVLNILDTNKQDQEIHRKFQIKPSNFSIQLWG